MLKVMETCPVCDRKFEETRFYSEFGLEESYGSCQCGYAQDYSYGATRVVVDGKEFLWSYDVDYGEFHKISRELNEAIADAAKKYLSRPR